MEYLEAAKQEFEYFTLQRRGDVLSTLSSMIKDGEIFVDEGDDSNLVAASPDGFSLSEGLLARLIERLPGYQEVLEVMVPQLLSGLEFSHENPTELEFQRELSALIAREDAVLVRQMRRVQVLKAIERHTGRRFHVVSECSDPRVAGFANMENREVYILEALLDDEGEARHVAVHEAWHVRTGIDDLDIIARVDPRAAALLTDVVAADLHIPLADIRLVNLLEGFNELVTIDYEGELASCAYNSLEVPVAASLETLSRKVLGVSIQDLYEAGDDEMVIATIVMLSERLLELDVEMDVFAITDSTALAVREAGGLVGEGDFEGDDSGNDGDANLDSDQNVLSGNGDQHVGAFL